VKVWEASLADASATRRLGVRVGQAAAPGLFVALVGGLGAGKTTFAQGVGEALGVQGAVVSPTFTLVSVYDEARPPLVHADLYRLQRVQELEQLGFEDLLDGAVALVEWADRFPEVLPEARLTVRLSMEGVGRRARLEARGPLAQGVITVLAAFGDGS
jgi:tRNA threonylcarbamoyladenosine biosynthesis protein TsaE